MIQRVEVIGLREFRSACRRARGKAPQQLKRGLERAGEPAIRRLRTIPARNTGALAGGYGVQVRGTVADIVNPVPYSAGADWGQHGKWKGFQKYGGIPRFAGRIVEEQREEIGRALDEELKDIITVNGWAHGWM